MNAGLRSAVRQRESFPDTPGNPNVPGKGEAVTLPPDQHPPTRHLFLYRLGVREAWEGLPACVSPASGLSSCLWVGSVCCASASDLRCCSDLEERRGGQGARGARP